MDGTDWVPVSWSSEQRLGRETASAVRDSAWLVAADNAMIVGGELRLRAEPWVHPAAASCRLKLSSADEVSSSCQLRHQAAG